ncbi:MAG: hypothetical protein AB7O04_07115 [Hyphomonadaceae bacterium]
MSENEHVLSGLVRKRQQIAGEIAYHQERWRQLSADIIAIDQAIQIIAPDYEAGDKIARYIPPPHQAYKGEIARLIADAFRENPGCVLSTLEIATHVMLARGLNADDPALRKLIAKRVGACLAVWRKKGRVRSERPASAPVTGEGSHCVWMLCSASSAR